MSTSAERLHYLLQVHAEKKGTAEEMQELNALLEDDWNRIELGRQAPHIDWEKMYRQIMAAPVVEMQSHRSYKKWYRIAAAAVVLLALSTVAYFWLFNKPSTPAEVVSVTSPEITAPAVNRAAITLADGRRIYLDSAANGMLTRQGDASLSKSANGQVVYQLIDQHNTQSPAPATVFNTLSNPRGSNIVTITLADGTKVWLNSESSLKYPATFSGKERRVQVTGEAYFEVTHDAAKPFYVTFNNSTGNGGGEVQVLGTHFNINAYDDEDVAKTTLLEGSVKVKSSVVNSQWSLLKPGEQAVLTHHSPLTIHNADVEQVTAWTTGFFQFNNLDIETILRQLSRWYNVDVAYESHPAARRFGGRISNQLNLSEVLRLLESNGIHSRLEGRKIIVLP